MANQIELNVLDLYLDSENPRHDPINDQSLIIEHLLKNEQIRRLARDISEYGISPIDRFAVIKDETENFIVVEGNRRLCALLLLNDPDRAPEGDRTYFKRLVNENTKFPNKVLCVEFDDRESADIWIERRHEGLQEGIGTKQWDATQKTRHNTKKSKNDTNALAQAIIDFGIAKGFIPTNKSAGILTTATRYLSNPLFRQTIGVVTGSSDPDVQIAVDMAEFERVIQKFAEDLLDDSINSPVSSRSNKVERENYARKLANDGFAPKKHTKPTKLANPVAPAPNAPPKPNNSGARNNQNPDKRKYVIPSDFKVRIKNPILRRVFEELRTLEVDSHTLAASFLCRAFLENIYVLYHEKIISSTIPKYTDKVMEAICNQVDADIKNGSVSLKKEERNAYGFFKGLPSGINKELNPKNLGANAHANHYPDPINLRREWDNVQAFILYMLGKL